MIKFNKDKFKKLSNKKIALSTAGALLCTTLLTGCNRQLFDTKYGLNSALIYGDDTAIVVDLADWKDYEGEQLQISTNDGMIVLSSAFDTKLFTEGTETYSAQNLAKNGISEDGELYELGESNNAETTFNYDMIDTNWKFDKAITFNGNNALILPIYQWKDYQGEQLQICTEDGLVMVLSSWNSKLVYDEQSKTKANDLASMYVGSDGNVTDLSNGNTETTFNKDLFDTNWGFNKAIVMKDNTITIYPITKWCDYEGEQLQLTIDGGPVIVTAAYDTIMLNDIESKTKAIDIANALGKNMEIRDYSDGYNYSKQIGYNGTIFDFKYDFPEAILTSENSATTFETARWSDYEGEQLQIELPSGDIILSSSVMLDLISNGNKKMNANTMADDYVSEEGKTIKMANDVSSTNYNYRYFDTKNTFNYAIKTVNGNVTIIPINKWDDFYNSDGSKNKDDSPNCEQIQLVLPDGSVIVTTAYDTALVKCVTDINDIAEYFRGANGVINDLTTIVGEPNPIKGWNIDWFDTHYNFNQAILANGETVQVFNIKKWMDFSEGEQLQLLFSDNSGILTSFVDTTLMSTNNEELVDFYAASLNGQTKEAEKTLVYKYK